MVVNFTRASGLLAGRLATACYYSCVGYGRGVMATTTSDDHAEIRDFLNSIGVGVLATVNDKCVPHAATIYFIVDPDLTIHFLTKEHTTKHTNLQRNPRAALVVHNGRSQTTVQIQGKTTKLTRRKERVNQLYARISVTAKTTSDAGILPIDKLKAGGFVAYSLRPNSVRMAKFADAKSSRPSAKLFEQVTLTHNGHKAK